MVPVKVLLVQVGSQKYTWMFNFFSFDVLLIAKFGYTSLWMITTTTMATLQNSLKKQTEVPKVEWRAPNKSG
jgi:hypothetical protein